MVTPGDKVWLRTQLLGAALSLLCLIQGNGIGVHRLSQRSESAQSGVDNTLLVVLKARKRELKRAFHPGNVSAHLGHAGCDAWRNCGTVDHREKAFDLLVGDGDRAQAAVGQSVARSTQGWKRLVDPGERR